MAKSSTKKVFTLFFIFLNIIVVGLFLSASLLPWINPSVYPSTGFIGLLFPFSSFLLIISFIFWLIVKPKLALIPAIALLIGWKQISVFFAFHGGDNFSLIQQDKSIRIVDWNIRSFNGLSNNKAIKKHTREDIASTIMRLDADVVCLQEFNTIANALAETNNISLFNKKYPYYYFSKDYTSKKGLYQSGCIIFSKNPIIDTGKVKYKPAESLIHATIVKGTDTFSIFTTHLQSFKFNKQDYTEIDKIKDQDEDAIINSKNLFQKMRLAFKRRGLQANIVKEALQQNPYPSVICGDFNDVPNSYTYFHIKQDRQDVFQEKGFGIGRTFISLASTLRIDYILPDKNFETLQFDMVDEDLSDHILLVADLRLKK